MSNSQDDRMERIENKLDKMSDVVMEIKTWTACKTVDCTSHMEKTNKLIKQIEGNGKIGVLDRLDKIEKDNMKEIVIDKQKSKVFSTLKTLALPIIAAILSTLFFNILVNPSLLYKDMTKEQPNNTKEVQASQLVPHK